MENEKDIRSVVEEVYYRWNIDMQNKSKGINYRQLRVAAQHQTNSFLMYLELIMQEKAKSYEAFKGQVATIEGILDEE